MPLKKTSTLKELFNEWEKKNNAVGERFQEFDISSLREIRMEQRKIEDQIYNILLKSAPPDILKILPEDCGSMELGFEKSEQKFYFLMEDPDQNDEETLKILAITIDQKRNVESIKDFKKEV
jgi:hypothetical protein